MADLGKTFVGTKRNRLDEYFFEDQGYTTANSRKLEKCLENSKSDIGSWNMTYIKYVSQLNIIIILENQENEARI